MISSYLSLIGARANLDEKMRSYLAISIDGAVRMKGLIMSMLEYATVGATKPTFTRFPASEAVGAALANLRLKIDEVKPAIAVGDLPTITADKALIVQILQNLIGNAIKYRSENPRIAITAAATEQEWIFAIEDNGIGIKPDDLKRVFEAFQRLHTTAYAGYGIGLATCRRITDVHGGRLWVESTYGVGSQFFFSLKKALVDPQEDAGAVILGDDPVADTTAYSVDA